jgi:hypothetical protein
MEAPAVTAPPEAVFQRIAAGGGRRGRTNDVSIYRSFYKKYIDVKGMPVMASGEVADEALQRTWWIVTHILAGRPDVLDAMVTNHTRLIIIGKDQVYTDMPEYRNSPNPEFQNERVRGTGGLGVTSFGEENLLNLPIDRYDDMSVGVHEFCHTIDGALRAVEGRAWSDRKNAVFNHAKQNGLWKGSYAGSNSSEYWSEICTAYFDCERINNWNHAAVGTREQLKEYDPMGYELVQTAFNLTPENDWFYIPWQLQPGIIAPPARFKIDPYYTKFTWAREFNVVSRSAGDEAMFKANDTVRKMFAYRHDILKVFINDDAKLAVLGPGERLRGLPEFKNLRNDTNFDLAVRMCDYSPVTKTFVIGEENSLGTPDDPYLGRSMVIRLFARAIYTVCGTRPVDPSFRPAQQYELGLKRLDVQWGQRVEGAYTNALANGKWKGTSAVVEPAEYWANGVLAYFDAAGPGWAANDAPHPIRTREQLKEYDPDLFALVAETMAYEGHEDWRYDAHRPYVRSPEMTMHAPIRK